MKINGIEFDAPELTLDNLLALENMGVAFDDIVQRPMNFLVAYVALGMGTDVESSKRAISAHLNRGGDLVAVLGELSEVVSRSQVAK